MSLLRLYFLGMPRLELDGRRLVPDRRKATALLAYLAVEGGAPSRETLATLFFPASEQSTALAYLRRTLFSLTQTLPGGWISADRDTVQLQSEGVWVDCAAFQDLLSASRPENRLARLEEAIALYRDDFLTGFTLEDCPAFDEWAYFQRETLRRALVGALDELIAILRAQNRFADALVYARRRVTLEPADESAQRLVMDLYVQSDQRAAALRQYHELVRVLRDEFQSAPQAETTRLYESIQSGRVVASPATAERPRLPLLTNLPAEIAPFIGREAELAYITQVLASEEGRLITLVGVGGVGKTRLALRVAQAQLERFPDGVWFLPLASVAAPDLLALTLANTMQLELEVAAEKDVQTRLLHFLRERTAFLVLDNFEHLVDGGVPFVLGLLQSAPHVKLLITSRMRLNIHGEWALELGGLSYPETAALAGEAYGAVQLFLQTARRSVADFAPAHSDLEAIGQICRLMEGLPLGIELAAGWVNVLSCQEIAAEISRSLDFLTATRRDVPERHRSLRAVFDRSLNLLPPPEQETLSKLAIFRGGFTREAAAAVAQATLPVLAALTNKSLLSRNTHGRYELHELVRQYAAERLAQDPAAEEALIERHMSYYLEWLAQWEAELEGLTLQTTRQQITLEIDNIRAAWNQAWRRGHGAPMAAAMEGLFLFYDMCGWEEEGEEMLGRAAAFFQREYEAHPSAETARHYGRARVRYSWFIGRAGGEPLAILEEMLALFQRYNLREETGVALLALGWREGDRSQSARYFEESLQIFRALNYTYGTIRALDGLAAMAALVGKYDESKRINLDILATVRAAGDISREAFPLLGLGNAARLQGDFEEARRYFLRAEEIARTLGSMELLSYALGNLCLVEKAVGNLEQAQQTARAGLDAYERHQRAYYASNKPAGSLFSDQGVIARAMGDDAQALAFFQATYDVFERYDSRWGLGFTLNNLGTLATRRGDFAGARALHRRSLALCEGINNRYDQAVGLIGLAQAELGLGDRRAAQAALRHALQIAVELAVKPIILDCGVVTARLIAAAAPDQAVHLLNLAITHPAADIETRQAAAHELQTLSAPAASGAPVAIEIATVAALIGAALG